MMISGAIDDRDFALQKEIALQRALKHRHLIELHLLAFLHLFVNFGRHILIGQSQDLDDVIVFGRRLATSLEK